MDPEARLSIVDRRFEQMRLIVQRHGGALVSSIGDSGTVVFGTPRIREDDALRAVRAAADLAGCLSQADEWTPRRLRPRIGINTGLALIGERDNVVLGDAIDLAVRLEHAAAPGQILLGPETVALVRHAVRIEPLGSRSARGEPELEWAGRLIWTDSSHRVYEDPQDLLAHLDEVGVRRPL